MCDERIKSPSYLIKNRTGRESSSEALPERVAALDLASPCRRRQPKERISADGLNMKRSTGRLILILASFALFFWTVDAFLDWTVFYRNRTFWGFMLTNVPHTEVFSRLLTIATCVILGVAISRYYDVWRRAESERNRLATIVESSRDAIYSTSIDGFITYWNRGAEKLYGYTREDMMGKHFSLLFPPERRDEAMEQFERIKRGESARLSESVQVKKDGALVHVSLNVSVIKDEAGTTLGSATIARDITKERMMRDALASSHLELEQRVAKRTRELEIANACLAREMMERTEIEEDLRRSTTQLRNLYSQLLTAQESERKRISRELHDDLGQALATLKLRLGHIARNSDKGAARFREECTWAAQFVDEMIEGVRRLSRDLSPTVLEHFGLSAAIRRLAEEFSKHHGIRVSVDLGECDHFFAKDAQIHLYRIFQEALNNIGKYAQATRVTASVRLDDGHVSLTVEDDGRGFDPADVSMGNSGRKGLGLAIMRERASMLGGVFDLRSEKGRGTSISLSVPISQEMRPHGAV
jgi:PAS domain S-box-containing protein